MEITIEQRATAWILAASAGRRGAKQYLRELGFAGRADDLEAAIAGGDLHGAAREVLGADPTLGGRLSAAEFARIRTVLGLPPVPAR